MVKEFKFKGTGKEIKIEGESYFINVADPLVISELISVAERYKNLEDFNTDNLLEVKKNIDSILEDLVKTIDITLGKGSAAKIFKNKSVDFVNAIGLLEFITSEAFEYSKEQKNQYNISSIKRV